LGYLVRNNILVALWTHHKLIDRIDGYIHYSLRFPMPKVVVYSTNVCPYCVRAKSLLQRKGVEYEELNIDQDMSLMEEMMERSQRRTVPQIFIDEFHVGGYDDMAELDAEGRLDELLGIPPQETDEIT
jgi:glutaredoxin 3